MNKAGTDKNNMECPRCGGGGKVVHQQARGDPVFRWTLCGMCRGKRRIPEALLGMSEDWSNMISGLYNKNESEQINQGDWSSRLAD